jgi:hypothetical protein
VTHFGEKCGFGPVDLRQGFGALALLFIGARICDRGGHTGSQEIVEGSIVFIQGQTRAHTGYEDSGRSFDSRWADRERQGFFYGLWIRATGKWAESPFQVVDVLRLPRANHLREGPTVLLELEIHDRRACDRSRVGGGALTRWPPSAAQTARTHFV